MRDQIVSWISATCRKLEPAKRRVRRQFEKRLGYSLNLDNPQTFNEKLNWLKIYDRNLVYTKMVDKIEVKKFIATKYGDLGLNIIPTLGVWKNVEEIDFDSLPNQFVIKCAHDSGSVRVVKDKSQINVDVLKKFLGERLKTNYYSMWREWPYKHVKPRILIEPFMGILNDFKFLCFNGVVKCFDVDIDRFSSHRVNYYDRNKKLLNFGLVELPPDFNREIALPSSIEQMIEISEKISKDVPFLRVDLYDINGTIYFGELTFFPSAGYGGFEPIEADYELGAWLELPKKHSFFRRKTS